MQFQALAWPGTLLSIFWAPPQTGQARTFPEHLSEHSARPQPGVASSITGDPRHTAHRKPTYLSSLRKAVQELCQGSGTGTKNELRHNLQNEPWHTSCQGSFLSPGTTQHESSKLGSVGMVPRGSHATPEESRGRGFWEPRRIAGMFDTLSKDLG